MTLLGFLVLCLVTSLDKGKMIGLRLPLGPAFLPGFWSGIDMPSFISVGYTPDSVMRLNISAIFTKYDFWTIF